MTKQDLKIKIENLQEWLDDHHPEDEQRPEIIRQLRESMIELNAKDYEDYN